MSSAEKVSVTVHLRDGAFVYKGEREDGSANWQFLKQTNRGLKPGPVPSYLQRLLKKQKRTNAD